MPTGSDRKREGFEMVNVQRAEVEVTVKVMVEHSDEESFTLDEARDFAKGFVAQGCRMVFENGTDGPLTIDDYKVVADKPPHAHMLGKGSL